MGSSASFVPEDDSDFEDYEEKAKQEERNGRPVLPLGRHKTTEFKNRRGESFMVSGNYDDAAHPYSAARLPQAKQETSKSNSGSPPTLKIKDNDSHDTRLQSDPSIVTKLQSFVGKKSNQSLKGQTDSPKRFENKDQASERSEVDHKTNVPTPRPQESDQHLAYYNQGKEKAQKNKEKDDDSDVAAHEVKMIDMDAEKEAKAGKHFVAHGFRLSSKNKIRRCILEMAHDGEYVQVFDKSSIDKARMHGKEVKPHATIYLEDAALYFPATDWPADDEYHAQNSLEIIDRKAGRGLKVAFINTEDYQAWLDFIDDAIRELNGGVTPLS
mmetsp:Transcript_21898/g.32635  ORF Transcript_21898/g.32635 Transcript_21898/m.32635 type:complete len:326 (+) Transcript_21898:75-1052(+)